MQKIVPHLWFDKQEQLHEATKLYTSLFKDSQVLSTKTITGTPSGDCDIVTFQLASMDFMAINAGPYFKFNPAISFFVSCESEKEIEKLWETLIQGGEALMEYNTYPWAKKYGWLKDKFGLSWQFSWTDQPSKQKITPTLLFTQDKAGKAKEAMEFYVSLFPNSQIDLMVPYEKGDGDQEGFLKFAQFSLDGQSFMAMDSSADHKFVFNEAISLLVNCKDQNEIDELWKKMSAVPESEQCGWLKDKFGVSWQIQPEVMNEMMEKGTKEQIDRVTQAFLKMKKFDIATLERAFEGKE